MKTDLEIAQAQTLQKMTNVAAAGNIPEQALEPYGHHKAKVDLSVFDNRAEPTGKLILVTAITPTPAGEGKTTTTIGLADGLRRLGLRSAVALREPSLGPVFGLKGGAAGGGYAQVVPMEELNLHFTGDFHAIGTANNLLAALLDNHIQQGNALGIDPRRIVWRRALDMNDRQLRQIVSGLGGKANGTPREDGFDITVASEVMAVFCLADSIHDLRARLARMVVAYTYAGEPVTAGQLKAAGAMTVLLKEALKPNLVQTLEGTPALVHGGPFANIAHGCNSLLATRLGLSCCDYLVTEAGFGADLGAEKFLDIKCRMSGLWPQAAVVVATVRALKAHGGVAKAALGQPDLDALARGLPNLMQHVANLTEVFGLPVVVALNRFPTDTEEELKLVAERCAQSGITAVLSEVWAKGGEGGIELAEAVVAACRPDLTPRHAYALEWPIAEKLSALAQRIYRADQAVLTPVAARQAEELTKLGFGELPVCVAKTQYSFSDNPARIGAPRDFQITVRSLRLSAGAGFIVALTGDIMTMPGLPRVPAAEQIDITEAGQFVGLS